MSSGVRGHRGLEARGRSCGASQLILSLMTLAFRLSEWKRGMS